jgi:hypothetical protein
MTNIDVAEVASVYPERCSAISAPQARCTIAAACREVHAQRTPLDVPDRVLVSAVRDDICKSV